MGLEVELYKDFKKGAIYSVFEKIDFLNKVG